MKTKIMKTETVSVKKHKKNWEAYCQTSFNNMRSNIENWGKPDYFRPITRTFYINVFDCASVNHLGLISEQALLNPTERTHDHCLSPQFIGRMVMDNPEIYLNDYDNFKRIFWLGCSTITVTKKENTALSLLTDNDGYDYKVYVPTNLKYNHLNINLFTRVGSLWKNSVPAESNIIDTPQELLEYEKNFLVG